jgi:4-hydroxy-3-polyprenylbenzoate decarboxylase
MEASGLPVVVGVTGASGAAYARALLRALLGAGVPTHLVVSASGQRVVREELGCAAGGAALLGWEREDPRLAALVEHPARDVGAAVASGSFRHRGMVVAPCSSATLGALAGGYGDTLVHRAAHVCLKERRPLVLLHRETPLSLIDIRNMETLTLAGAVVMPAAPGFYHHPDTAQDLVDFMVARVLDHLGLAQLHGYRRWNGGQGAAAGVTE